MLNNNWYGLGVNVHVYLNNGLAEHEVTKQILAYVADTAKRKTIAVDTACHTIGFVTTCREPNDTPHIAPNLNRLRGSTIDRRSTRRQNFAISMRARKNASSSASTSARRWGRCRR